MATINKVKVSGATGIQVYDILPLKAISASTADVAGATYGVGMNAKSNLEISNRPDSTIEMPVEGTEEGSKVNIVSYGSIQIKPGMKSATKAGEIAFDNEFNSKDPYELKMHICNGVKDASNNDVYSSGDTMALKLNVAEVTFDTKNAEPSKFDAQSIDLKFCNDKFKLSDGGNPIQAKLKARSFDLRCYGHGGVALQPAGHDGSGHENKIKFESSRISEIGATAEYCDEGGKGLEFGTFNTEHTSLYTGDYRFKGDAKVYGVTRLPLSATSTGKIDYPTQNDDFKDVIDPANTATWNEIIDVAKAYKNGTIGASGSGSASGETAPAELSAYVTKESYNTYTGATATELDRISTVETVVSGLSASAPMKYVTCDGEKVVVDATSIIVGYDYGDGTSGATETIEVADGSGSTVVLTGTAMNTAKVNLKSNRKISLKGKDGIEVEGANIIFPMEISKKNKVTCGDYEVTGATSAEQVFAAFPKIGFRLEKNNSTFSSVSSLGTNDVTVSIYDLVKLVDKVSALEAKVAKFEKYYPFATILDLGIDVTSVADQAVFGVIVNADTLEPINGATILFGAESGAVANENGIWANNTQSPASTISVEATGYVSRVVEWDASKNGKAITLEPIK